MWEAGAAGVPRAGSSTPRPVRHSKEPWHSALAAQTLGEHDGYEYFHYVKETLTTPTATSRCRRPAPNWNPFTIVRRDPYLVI